MCIRDSHEGLPGHHLQISVAQELTGIPDFRKYTDYIAYTEGWGLYAERLGKDAGFYQDPYNDYGRLEADIWRAVRLVVDTGVHSQHWTCLLYTSGRRSSLAASRLATTGAVIQNGG